MVDLLFCEEAQIARNEDDHLKNLAWLYDGDRWTLSPAYDLTYAPHAAGHRQTSVLGSTQRITRRGTDHAR